MPMYLVPLEGGDPIALDKAVTFIGRHPDCDVVLHDSRKVSRKHCCIAQINEAFVVRDLGSMNGVRVNDDVSHEEMRVRPGDELWVGDIGFRMEFRPAQPKVKVFEERHAPSDALTPKGGNQSLRNAQLDHRFVSQDVSQGASDSNLNRENPPASPPTDQSDVIELPRRSTDE